MSRTLTCKVRLEIEGVAVPGLPYVGRLQVEDIQQWRHVRAADSIYRPIPVQELPELNAFAVTPTQPVTVRLGGTGTGPIPINRGGLVLVFNGEICATPARNAEAINAGTLPATLVGFGAGNPVPPPAPVE